MKEQTATFNKGDKVEHAGTYVCVPCGFKKHFVPGDTFTECTSCLAGSKSGHENYLEGLELWEQAKDEEPAATPDT